MKLELLYKKTKKDQIQTWEIEIEGNKFRTNEGILNGTITTSEWTTCFSQNIGRSNETTPEDQALKEAPIVCMLLKSQYWHAKKRYDLFVKNKPAYILPLTWRPDFLNGEKGGSPTMEVLWTVWIKGNHNCEYIPLLKP